ncbi:hypothetical protein FRC06_009278 [Ceratobasidium sp. 370]|nr:hypothetical protein FRC06_009278 [Ceratobasidium sp. 370]
MLVAHEFFDAIPIHIIEKTAQGIQEVLIDIDRTAQTISWGIAQTAGKLVGASGGGAGLVIDYGDDRAFGSSFRAFQKHKVVDVFHEPGMCDLTANVDFAYLKEALATAGAASHGPVTQQAFLTRMGAAIRLQKLLDSARDGERRTALEKGARRLMDPLGMGTQYKVLGISSVSETVYPFST